jgi:anti-sigma28 factor (negative regulator of flagellin synthesis)
MKINPKKQIEQEALKSARQQETSQAAENQKQGAAGIHQNDSVKLNLGRAIGELLNVEDMKTERQNKVQELKRLIEAGEYNPSSQKIAEAVGHEIALEILTKGGSQD